METISTVKFTVVGALVVALGMAVPVPDANAQPSASGERVVRRLGGTTRFSPPVRSVDAVRRMTTARQADLKRILEEVGLASIAPQVIETLTTGAVTTTTVAPGEHLEWMMLRRKGRADVLRNVRWGGAKPFAAYRFTVDTPTMGYVFVVPQDCGNLSLVSATAVAPKPAPPPPPPPPAPAPPPPPPPAAAAPAAAAGTGRSGRAAAAAPAAGRQDRSVHHGRVR